MALSSTVKPRVSIVIPCRNERGHMGTCLASTLNQMEPAGGFEVIVADGMSDDGTREILARLAEEVAGKLSVVNGPSDLCPPPSEVASGSDASAFTPQPSQPGHTRSDSVSKFKR